MTKKKFNLFVLIGRWILGAYDRFILWMSCTSFSLFLAVFVSLKRYRMSHNNGIAGTGWLRVLDNPKIPRNEFFKPGRVFDIRVRHATAAFLDDAMKTLRSISIKFANDRSKSPLDLEFNTGHSPGFWSALSFIRFAKTRGEKYGVEWVDYNRKHLDASLAVAMSMRRNATSFQNLWYYSKAPFNYIAEDGIRYYCKYKVRPYEDIQESGVDHNPDLNETPNQRVLPHDTRGRNYLKDEYIERIKKGPAKYRLQIQLHLASDDDDPEVFNSMRVWDETIHPWLDLAEFEVNEMLDWKESTFTLFSMKNMPKSLGLIPAKSIYDYNSLNYLRRKSHIARVVRIWALKIFGMVPPIPDDDIRNIRVWTKPV